MLHEETHGLGTVFDKRITYNPVGVSVSAFTGAPDTCWFSYGKNGPTISINTTGDMISDDTPMDNLWIHNSVAQAGRTLKLLMSSSSSLGSMTRAYRHITPNAVIQGHVTITAGTAVQLPDIDIPEGITPLIRALTTNTKNIAIGGSDVALTGATGGHLLAPGEDVYFDLQNLSALYGIADTSSQTLSYVIEVNE